LNISGNSPSKSLKVFNLSITSYGTLSTLASFFNS
jgi:hypothetical protein